MGYSVLITLGKNEQEKVKKFLAALTEKNLIGPATADENGNAKHDSLFGAYTSEPRMENLSYQGRHKDGNFVGCDYGQYDIAHTFINWMGTVLGKETYVYDGGERLSIHPEKKIVCSRLLGRPRKNESYEKNVRIWESLKIRVPSKEKWEKDRAEEIKEYHAFRRRLHKLVKTLQKVWDETHPPKKPRCPRSKAS